MLIAIPAFLVVISIVIVFHELGHYWVARLFKTKIDAFSIGFGPRLFGWVDRLGTEWKVCALPLGGYVKFHGDAHAASAPDRERLEEIKQKIRSEGVDPHSILHFKPVWQRALVVFAGPFANFVLALVLLTGIYSILGEPSYPVIIAKVLPNTPAQAAGLQPGDQIIAISGWKVYSFTDVTMQVSTSPGKSLTFAIKRGNAVFDRVIKLQPKQITYDEFGRQRVMRGGQLGIERTEITQAQVTMVHHDPITAAARGIEFIVLNLRATYWYLGDVLAGRSAPDQLGGTVRIAAYSGKMASSGPFAFTIFIAFISVCVGVINLFPIPVLDGGHLLFYAIEAIQGRPLSHQVQEIGFRIGLVLIVALFIFVTWNDIIYLLPGSSKPGSP